MDSSSPKRKVSWLCMLDDAALAGLGSVGIIGICWGCKLDSVAIKKKNLSRGKHAVFEWLSSCRTTLCCK